MIPQLTDDAVADLPLSHGRADLLEEIMATPVLDDRPVRTDPPRRRTTWAVPVAAAAAVIALVTASGWLLSNLGLRGAEVAGASDAYRAVLDAPGWTVDSVAADDASGELSYTKGDQSFHIDWYPAEEYAGYVEDRRHITDTPVEGEPVQVLGQGGLLWEYNDLDHTVIRDVENGHLLELRGKRMPRATYLALLQDVRLVDRADFEALMPASFVDGTERGRQIDEVLADLRRSVDPIYPPEGTRRGVSSTRVELDEIRADVVNQVVCSWLDDFAEATRAGDAARAQRAADVLATAPDWPVLKQIDPGSDYPESLWPVIEKVAQGRLPKGYGRTLACQG